MPLVLSTRSLNSQYAASLKQSGWRFFTHNFIQKKIDLSNISANSLRQHIVLTSQTGVQAFVQLLGSLKLNRSRFSIFCISKATRLKALQHGLNVAGCADNALALAETICRTQTVTGVSCICSNLHRNDLSEYLTNAGIEVNILQAYTTLLTPIKIDFPYHALLFFSPSAVDSFLVQNTAPQAPCFCIGKTTSRHALLNGFFPVIEPQVPSEEAVLKEMCRYFLNNATYAEK